VFTRGVEGVARKPRKTGGAIFAIKRAMEQEPKLKVTIPELVEADVLDGLFIEEKV
jgi:urocanate hydratase